MKTSRARLLRAMPPILAGALVAFSIAALAVAVRASLQGEQRIDASQEQLEAVQNKLEEILRVLKNPASPITDLDRARVR